MVIPFHGLPTTKMMRVIAGTHKRRTLKTVNKPSTRSTKDRVKETLFAMLGPLYGKKHVLDAFAGAGALGIEALSRGVERATFLESDHDAFTILNENLDALDLASRAKSIWGKAEKCISDNLETKYDLIMLDPPYHANVLEAILSLIVQTECLASSGICVTLASKRLKVHAPKAFQTVKTRTIGITNVCFYEWSE